MFRYIKAFRIMMKRKDLEERYILKFATFSILGTILSKVGEDFTNVIIITIGLISVAYGLYYLTRLIWKISSNHIKEFFKELKETVHKLK